jgi:hypothetical protein
MYNILARFLKLSEMVYIITSLLPRDIGKGKSGVLLARRVPRG